MSTELVTKCDICSKAKGQVNHWFTVWIQDDVFHSAPLGSIKFDENPPKEVKDACGIDHAQIFYNRFLSNRTFSTELPEKSGDN